MWIIPNRVYRIVSCISSKHYYVIDCASHSTENGACVMLWNNIIVANNQNIRIVSVSNGCYELEFCHSGKLIDVSGGAITEGAKVCQWERNGHTNQQWRIVPADKESYFIIDFHSGMYLSSHRENSILLSCTNDPKHFGAELVVCSHQNKDDSNQRWKIVPSHNH